MSEKIEKLLRKLHISRRIFAVVAVGIIVFTVIILILVNSLVRSIMENHYFDNDKELQYETAQSTELLITDVNLLLIRLMGDEGLTVFYIMITFHTTKKTMPLKALFWIL